MWTLAFVALAVYVAARMGIWPFWVNVAGPDGVVALPNTFATVDHPFHVARAETLWRELGSGQLLRWVGQHQGGYPVEFYPLGEAWLEVFIRAASLGLLPAEAAHSLAVVAIFLFPAVGILLLGKLDQYPPVVALLALALHVSLPGGWYSGGYTELVQWGLVTNVAGAVAVFVVLPLLLRFLQDGSRWALLLAVTLSALAVYSNPRSLVGLLAVGLAAAIAAVWARPGPEPGVVVRRLLGVGALAALLAAPELIALLRFGGLYTFVRYSGYASVGDYLSASVAALALPVVVLGVAGAVLAPVLGRNAGTLATAIALLLYGGATLIVAFVPAVAGLASQLEPTRLMPLQRLLLLYLAASFVWFALRSLVQWISPGRSGEAAVALATVAVVILALLTRPVDPPPDPADPTVSPVGLYRVEMSGQPQQLALQQAVREADAAAAPGTALLVLGSALSWHQALWAPLWTGRPLYYDNWLWFWRHDHVGTPGYQASAGNHYPDPERTLTPEYLGRYGIGAVVATGPVQRAASASPLLHELQAGQYATYLVQNPVTTVTMGGANVASEEFSNQRLDATAARPAHDVNVRASWFPRWRAAGTGVTRTPDGQMALTSSSPISSVTFTYDLQWQDWTARLMAVAGAVILIGAIIRKRGRRDDQEANAR